MEQERKYQTLTISLTAEQKADLKIMAAKKGITVSSMILAWLEAEKKKEAKKR